MRTGYTYDDEMPQSHGSFQNNNNRRPTKFTGRTVGHIGINPVTKEIEITPLTNEEQAKEDGEWNSKEKD